MELDWLCTGVLKVRHLWQGGLLWTIQFAGEAKRLSLANFNTRANRVAIVCSVITRMFNPMQTLGGHISTFFNPHSWLFMLVNNCPLPVTVFDYYSILFWFYCSFHCSSFKLFSSDSGMYSRYFDPVTPQHLSSSKSINIKHHTALSLS